MTNNDTLRRLRYTFDFSDDTMIQLFALGGLEATRAEISCWLKRDEDPEFRECQDEQLAAFLNGLIIHRRGRREGPPPIADKRLDNNLILRKLRIALDLKDEGMLEILDLAGIPVRKPELNALFRRPDHKNYRQCKDQFLRNFLQGVQKKYRSGD